jgi:hypothetical protein
MSFELEAGATDGVLMIDILLDAPALCYTFTAEEAAKDFDDGALSPGPGTFGKQETDTCKPGPDASSA